MATLEEKQTSRPAAPEALAVNYDEGYVVMDDDSVALIDLYIDAFGCETEDPKEAAALVGRISDGEFAGNWITVDLSQFVEAEVN